MWVNNETNNFKIKKINRCAIENDGSCKIIELSFKIGPNSDNVRWIIFWRYDHRWLALEVKKFKISQKKIILNWSLNHLKAMNCVKLRTFWCQLYIEKKIVETNLKTKPFHIKFIFFLVNKTTPMNRGFKGCSRFLKAAP